MRLCQEAFIAVVVMWFSFGQNYVQASEFIEAVSKDSPQQDMRELYARAQEKYSHVFSGDKVNVMLYKISDPKNKIKPFLLTDQSAVKMTHGDAIKYCDGAWLATEAQLHALNRAIQPFPHYQFAKNAIARIENTTFFGVATNYLHSENVFHFTVFDMYDGNLLSYVSFFTSVGDHKAYARCVLPLP